jgi:hypothetical protein
MGSTLACSAYTSGSASSYYLYSRIKRKWSPIDIEEVVYIEERCVNINDFTDLVSGKHSFLIATTSTGRQIRYEYNSSSAEPFIKYDYWEILPTSTFRKHLARPGLNVAQVTHIIRKHSLKSEYSLSSHNCQHVARDAYNEITGETEVMLRNDFLHMFMEVLPINVRDQIRRKKAFPTYSLRKLHRKIRDELAESQNKDEGRRRVNLFFSLGHADKLYAQFKDLRYLDNTNLDPETVQKLYEFFGETGVIFI